MTRARPAQYGTAFVVGAADWMVAIEARSTGNQALTMAGINVVFREIADLAPCDENGVILDRLGQT